MNRAIKRPAAPTTCTDSPRRTARWASAVALLLVLVVLGGCAGDQPQSGEPSDAGAVPLPGEPTGQDGAADPTQQTPTGELGAATSQGSAPDASSEPTEPVGAMPEIPDPDATAEPEGPAPLRIVALMGETNVMSGIDGPAIAGASAQVDRINEAGGVLGLPLELIRYDTESRISMVERLGERLLRDPPDLVLVSCDVAFAKPILEIADQQGLVTLSPCADDVGYATAAWGSRNFSLGAPPEPRGAIAAEVALGRYGATAMVLRDLTSPEALKFCNGFERTYRELGGSVIYRDEFRYDTLPPLLDRLADQARPSDLIVLCTHVPAPEDGAANVVEQLRLLGFSAPIVAGATLDNPSWFAKAPQLGELTYVSWSSIYGNDPSARVNDVTRRANEDLTTPPAGVSTVLGADAVDAWVRAVEAVRSADPARVAPALASFADEPFLTGDLSFLGGSRLDTSRTYRILRVRGGQVEVPDLATVDG